MTIGKEEVADHQEHPQFDEFPGEDKEDLHYEEIICKAMGLEDFFFPRKNSEEGYSGVTKELECKSDFRITPKKMKYNEKEELVSMESKESEFQMPTDLIAFTKLEKYLH